MADKDLKALFQHALWDGYSAEAAILKAVPRMAEAAQFEALRGALAVHLQEMEEQVRRLDKVSSSSASGWRGSSAGPSRGSSRRVRRSSGCSPAGKPPMPV